METAYNPVIGSFREELEALVAQKKYVKIRHFSDLHEFLSTAAIIQAIFTEQEAEFARLNTGEVVRLDKIARVDGKPAPGYDIEDYSCDC
jgi:Rho-binding antiterminator